MHNSTLTDNRGRRKIRMETEKDANNRAMEWTRDKTLQLLREYQQRRVLWDWNAKGYRDRAKRKRSIHELAESLGCNSLELEKKITNLKCQYSREIHKIQNSKEAGNGPHDLYVSKWFAFKSMQFLRFGTRRYSARKKQQKTIESNLQEEEYIVSDIDPESITFAESNDEETNGSGSFNPSLSKEHEEESLSSCLLSMDERYIDHSLLAREEMTNNDNTKGPSDRTRLKEEWIKFGESIALQLAEIPDSYSRSVAKLRINQILFEAEIGVYAQTRR